MKKIGEMHPPEEAVSLNEPPPQHRAPSFLSPKTYVPRASAQVVPPTRSHPPLEKKPVQPAEGATSADPKFIVLTLGDVLSRIPTQFLRHGMHDAKRELRFEMDDLSADIARGRAAVYLAHIVQQCPDIFLEEVDGFDDMQIRLPLQKLVEQISLVRRQRNIAPGDRPAAPIPSKPETTSTPEPQSESAATNPAPVEKRPVPAPPNVPSPAVKAEPTPVLKLPSDALAEGPTHAPAQVVPVSQSFPPPPTTPEPRSNAAVEEPKRASLETVPVPPPNVELQIAAPTEDVELASLDGGKAPANVQPLVPPSKEDLQAQSKQEPLENGEPTPIVPLPIEACAPAATESEAEKISLNLAAILRRCPASILVEKLPAIDETLRVTFPFAPIERQLATGKVEVSSMRFIAALPPELLPFFEAQDGMKVTLPLEEIFQNLPGQPFPLPSEPDEPPALEVALSPANAASRAEPLAETPVLEEPVGASDVSPEFLESAAAEVAPVEASIPESSSDEIKVDRVVAVATFDPMPVECGTKGVLPPSETPPVPEATLAPEPVADIAVPRAEPAPAESVTPEAIRFSPSIARGGDEPFVPKGPPPLLATESGPVPFVLAPTSEVHFGAPAPFVEPAAAPLPILVPVQAPIPAPIRVENPAPVFAAEEKPVVPETVPTAMEPAPLQSLTELIPVRPVLPSLRPPIVLHANLVSAPVPARPLETPKPAGGPPAAFQPPPASIPRPAQAPAPIPEPKIPPVLPATIGSGSDDGAPSVPILPGVIPRLGPAPVRPVMVAPPRIFTPSDKESGVVSSDIDVAANGPNADALREIAIEPAMPIPSQRVALDLPLLSRALAELPGIQACVVSAREATAHGGELPSELDPGSLRDLALQLASTLSPRASALSAGPVQHVTVHGERFSLSLFTRGEACVCAIHRARIFLPGVCERFVAAADELARSAA